MNTLSSSQSRQIGLLFGKFYPLHCGHVYFIEKAMSQVDELHVILGCEKTRDLRLFEQSGMTVQPQVQDRLSWLQRTFRYCPQIHIHVLHEEGIAFYPNGWKDWSDRVKQILAQYDVKPTVIFTSEAQDAQNHAIHYGCPVKLVDVERRFASISATEIRHNPYQHWSFIANAAKPFFVKKVAIISSNQRSSHLMEKLANVYNTTCVPNGYINYIYASQTGNTACALNEADYIKIMFMHAERINQALTAANKLLFTEIDFSALHQLYQNTFKQTHQLLAELEQQYQFDLVLTDESFAVDDDFATIFEKSIAMIDELI